MLQPLRLVRKTARWSSWFSGFLERGEASVVSFCGGGERLGWRLGGFDMGTWGGGVERLGVGEMFWLDC